MRSELHTTVLDRLRHLSEPKCQSGTRPPDPSVHATHNLQLFKFCTFLCHVETSMLKQTRYKSGTGLLIPNNDNKLKKTTLHQSVQFLLRVSEKPHPRKQLERSSLYITHFTSKNETILPSNKPVF